MRNFAPYTAFGKTKIVPVKVYIDGKYVDGKEEWDETLWVERGEDWYAFENKKLKGKRVRVIERNIWVRAVEQAS